ncbi:MAG TPA: glycosyltransferase, partial [Chloroflexota bacterium]
MRVVVVSKALVVGTYQRKMEELARCPGVELACIVPPCWHDHGRPIPLERVHTRGYELIVEPIRFSGRFHLFHFPGLRRRLQALRPEVVHIDEEPYNLATWHALWHARRSGARTLFFSWQNILRRYPPPIAWFERWVLRTVDHAITGTQSAADVWRAKGYRGPLTVIPQFGVDPVLFAPPAAPREHERFTVGFVGRLREEKGGADLLHALAQLPRERWRLAIVGDGPERGALLALAEQLGIGSNISIETRPSTQMPAFY